MFPLVILYINDVEIKLNFADRGMQRLNLASAIPSETMIGYLRQQFQEKSFQIL